MAYYYAVARTNYFKVKDVDAFTDAVSSIEVEVMTDEINGETLVSLKPSDDYEGGFPSVYRNDDDDYVDIEWSKVFQEHLADDWVAIIFEVGHEKLRYLCGYAEGYNNKGETFAININDFEQFAKLGKNIGEY